MCCLNKVFFMSKTYVLIKFIYIYKYTYVNYSWPLVNDKDFKSVVQLNTLINVAIHQSSIAELTCGFKAFVTPPVMRFPSLFICRFSFDIKFKKKNQNVD